MNFSIYTSLFNYSPEKFDILGAFENWFKYGDEIVVATFEDQKFQIEAAIKEEFGYDERIKIVPVKDTSLDDPFFDGKLKNAALQNCSNEVVIQQDADERIAGEKGDWDYIGKKLLELGAPVACMIPVIDLYKDLDHYKSINKKWYIHLKEGTKRGVVNFAWRKNNCIEVKESDSCELTLLNGELVPSFVSYGFDGNIGFGLNKECAHVVHTGYLDLNKRIENNKFWAPIWSKRAGKEIEVATTEGQLESENKAIPHGLPRKWWE